MSPCALVYSLVMFLPVPFWALRPRHNSFVCVGGRPAAELHAETMSRLDLFLAEGFEVVYMWEHDFIQWQREAT